MATDFSRIEGSKENIMPQRAGRKAESLTKAVEEGHTAKFNAEAVKIRMCVSIIIATLPIRKGGKKKLFLQYFF